MSPLYRVTVFKLYNVRAPPEGGSGPSWGPRSSKKEQGHLLPQKLPPGKHWVLTSYWDSPHKDRSFKKD